MNPVYDFEGQVALVTDANSGTGLATTKAFRRGGRRGRGADLDRSPGDRRHLQRGGRDAGRCHGQARGRVADACAERSLNLLLLQDGAAAGAVKG